MIVVALGCPAHSGPDSVDTGGSFSLHGDVPELSDIRALVTVPCTKKSFELTWPEAEPGSGGRFVKPIQRELMYRMIPTWSVGL